MPSAAGLSSIRDPPAGHRRGGAPMSSKAAPACSEPGKKIRSGPAARPVERREAGVVPQPETCLVPVESVEFRPARRANTGGETGQRPAVSKTSAPSSITVKKRCLNKTTFIPHYIIRTDFRHFIPSQNLILTYNKYIFVTCYHLFCPPEGATPLYSLMTVIVHDLLCPFVSSDSLK